MNRTIWWVVLIVAAGAILAALYYRSHQTSLRPVPPAAQAPAPKPAPEPAIRYPIEEKPQEKPLPALNQSDPTVKDRFNKIGADKFIAIPEVVVGSPGGPTRAIRIVDALR